ncbi:hypothetical protein AQJ91_09975 [Streptomyces dysideae]|uniref:Uncharacterized protein n=1 Tax=Streptomyces dysideae TaxID=909626 RepID=A0A117S1T1_9ACTN|nr:hypothetical protein [Streptomyces dysideae]KUO21289.1 hypothetical protein AQJ91_09975 [Streptomyces dysideae]
MRGPDNVPVIAEEREAERDVPLAVLSAMTHGKGPRAAAILESLAAALRTIDRDSAAVFVQRSEMVLNILQWRGIEVSNLVTEPWPPR